MDGPTGMMRLPMTQAWSRTIEAGDTCPIRFHASLAKRFFEKSGTDSESMLDFPGEADSVRREGRLVRPLDERLPLGNVFTQEQQTAMGMALDPRHQDSCFFG
jgi:hypothetical protein